MKTPLDPPAKDLAVALGIEARRKRDDRLRLAKAKSTRAPSHTFSGCNGTETLALIESALHRLASGTYGICVSCGSDISLARLEANPAIETCACCRKEASFKAH